MKQIIISIFFVILLSESSFPQQSVEKYGIYEISFEARISGNPFKDVQLKAIFEHGDVSKEVTGFMMVMVSLLLDLCHIWKEPGFTGQKVI
jgi:hypothetical protein